ncbi:MAG: hypothetical protein M1134_02245 [Actinobacteria bacterium]|nr:hypothetical protein [Actinomycetota bacterium]
MFAVFDRFSLPDLAQLSKRTVIGALVIGVVGLVFCLVLGAALAGVGLCIGLGLGISNFRMIHSSVAKVGARMDENKRRPLVFNTMGRLAVVSVIALGLTFISFDLGLGVMGGLALFQFLLLLNVTRSMLRPVDGTVAVIDADSHDISHDISGGVDSNGSGSHGTVTGDALSPLAKPGSGSTHADGEGWR